MKIETIKKQDSVYTGYFIEKHSNYTSVSSHFMVHSFNDKPANVSFHPDYDGNENLALLNCSIYEIHKYAQNNVRYEWFYHNILHRFNGPAYEFYTNGILKNSIYYWFNIPCTKEEHEKMMAYHSNLELFE